MKMPMTSEQLEAKVSELEALVAKTEEALDEAVLQRDLAQLDEADSTAYDGLTTDEKEQFAKADSGGRQALLAASAERIEKASRLSEDVQKQFDNIQKQLEDTEAKLRAAEAVAKAADDAQKFAVLKETAETQYPNIPGTAEEKARVLKSLGTLPEAESKQVLDILTKANEAFGSLTAPIGKSTSTLAVGSAWDKIEKKAAEHVAKGMTKEKATALVLEQNPELYKEYLQNAQ